MEGCFAAAVLVFAAGASLSVPDPRTRLFFEPRGRPGRRFRSPSSIVDGPDGRGGTEGVGSARCLPVAVALDV